MKRNRHRHRLKKRPTHPHNLPTPHHHRIIRRTPMTVPHLHLRKIPRPPHLIKQRPQIRHHLSPQLEIRQRVTNMDRTLLLDHRTMTAKHPLNIQRRQPLDRRHQHHITPPGEIIPPKPAARKHRITAKQHLLLRAIQTQAPRAMTRRRQDRTGHITNDKTHPILQRQGNIQRRHPTTQHLRKRTLTSLQLRDGISMRTYPRPPTGGRKKIRRPTHMIKMLMRQHNLLNLRRIHELLNTTKHLPAMKTSPRINHCRDSTRHDKHIRIIISAENRMNLHTPHPYTLESNKHIDPRALRERNRNHYMMAFIIPPTGRK